MKKLYTSPVVTVEELTKVDVLCASTETNDAPSEDKTDNINQLGSTIGDLTRLL
ncbi:MAG: hypothetical protein K6F88_06310 [Ruminococcus sp.]|nr:hypothetical protein [Ruminococcus sp.]